MAKGSYFQKYKEDNKDSLPKISHNIHLNDEQKRKFEEGSVILIDKEPHWTSFDVVRKIRNNLKIKKVGHAGTLDPLATGLLIICTGKFTKKINEYMAAQKEYTGKITLGAVTPTYDLESEPQDFKSIDGITEESILNYAQNYRGEQWQKPPVFSAIKKAGTRLYELARRGEDVELEPRKIFIHNFKITNINLPEIDFVINCSTGTYIRSIAHDMGVALKTGAYLSNLRRTAIGDFNIDNADKIDEWLSGLSQSKKDNLSQ